MKTRNIFFIKIDVKMIFDGLSSSKKTLETLKIQVPECKLEYFDFLSKYKKLKTFHFNQNCRYYLRLKNEKLLKFWNRRESSILTFSANANSYKILDKISISLEKNQCVCDEIIVCFFIKENGMEKDLDKKLLELCEYSKQTIKVYFLHNNDNADFIIE